MNSLSLVQGRIYSVNRSTVYEDVMTLYLTETNITNTHPVQIKFIDENAIDLGGVTREMFAAYYKEMYKNLFDGVSLLTPSIHLGTRISSYPVVGTILSHGYLLAGCLPVRVAFPVLAKILLPRHGDIPPDILIETFIKSLSCYDADIIRRAFSLSENKLPFSPDVVMGLSNFMSFYHCREIPKPESLKRVVLQIVQCVYQTKPTAAIAAMNSGIPSIHKPFWEEMTLTELYNIYNSLSASPTKILQLIDDNSTSNPKEERVLSYLRQYIGNMQPAQAQCFLRFVTGSSVCSAESIIVRFKQVRGLQRQPEASTCGSVLVLSSMYNSYADLKAEFDCILSNPHLWYMNAF